MSDDTEDSVTGPQMRAARALLGLSGERLAELSGVSLAAIRRAETDRGTAGMMKANGSAIRRTLEDAGVEFIAENGGGAGIRLRKPAS